MYDYITQSNIQLDMFKTQNGEIALKDNVGYS